MHECASNSLFVPAMRAVFGKVVEGTEVVLAISRTTVDADDRPKRPMRILKCSVCAMPGRETPAD